jgi:hypothetical protein
VRRRQDVAGADVIKILMHLSFDFHFLQCKLSHKTTALHWLFPNFCEDSNPRSSVPKAETIPLHNTARARPDVKDNLKTELPVLILWKKPKNVAQPIDVCT